MYKRDAVFYLATGIFVLSLILFIVTQNMNWLFLGIVSYLLRPTLASLGITGSNVDERQMTINYRSGNIAFAVTVITCVIIGINGVTTVPRSASVTQEDNVIRCIMAQNVSCRT